MVKKALVLFSGGLDSRVTAKIMEELGFEVHLVFVRLPFGCQSQESLDAFYSFAEEHNYKIHVVDATTGEKSLEYLKMIKNPKYGYGTAINPCKDCKIFIFKEGKRLMDELGCDVLVTGEVMGQRPMSQVKKALMFDEEVAGLTGQILRPLSAKTLPKTVYEESGLIDREKLYGLEGRKRDLQMELAEKYDIDYPTPGGGCLLCEKDYAKKLRTLYGYDSENLPKYEEILMLNKGRMFKSNGLLFVGRNHEENVILEENAKKIGWNVLKNNEIPGPTVVFDKDSDKELAEKLMLAYREKDLEKRKEFSSVKV